MYLLWFVFLYEGRTQTLDNFLRKEFVHKVKGVTRNWIKLCVIIAS